MKKLNLALAGSGEKASIKIVDKHREDSIVKSWGDEFAMWLYNNTTWVFFKAFMKRAKNLEKCK